jgi:hypothetical protein
LEFCIYDKGHAAGFTRDEVVRLECKLKTARMIKQCFTKELMFSELAFDDCYRVYRALTLSLSPEPVLKSGQTMTVASVLLLADSMGYRDFVDQVRNAMTQFTRSRTRKKMQTGQPRQAGIDLPALLPGHGPVAVARISDGGNRNGLRPFSGTKHGKRKQH